MHDLFAWLSDLEWNRFLPEVLGKFLGFLLGFAASWFLLFRRKLKALDRLKQGESDDVLFQAHYLYPSVDGKDVVLLFRNIAPSITLRQLFDNHAAREIVRDLAKETTLKDPVLQTTGTEGFEVLNDAFNHIAGHLGTTPFDRQIWLFAMTCEDRQVVRRRCVRCFLIRPSDLARFADWDWCRTRVWCEQPWHWYRIVALHQIALAHSEQERQAQAAPPAPGALPLVDEQMTHRRIRPMSAGIHPTEAPAGEPVRIPWENQEAELVKLGLNLAVRGGEPPRAPARGRACLSDL